MLRSNARFLRRDLSEVNVNNFVSSYLYDR